MSFLAMALDYDGTIAQKDVLDDRVRDSVSQLRAQNIIVLIGKGRILSDLQRVAGDFSPMLLSLTYRKMETVLPLNAMLCFHWRHSRCAIILPPIR